VTEDRGTSIRFQDIRIGDHVRVHARLVQGPGVLATELERSIPYTKVVLSAPLQFANDPQIILSGFSINTSAIPDNEFVGPYETIGRKAFFGKAIVGEPVRAKGDLAGNVVNWNSVGLAR